MQTHLEGINQMYNLMYRSDILYKKKTDIAWVFTKNILIL